MVITEPWQIAEVPGPKKATVIPKPEVVDAMIKRSKRPVLIVGHLAAETPLGDKMLIDYLIDLAKTRGIPVIATGKTNFTLMKKGYTEATIMTALDAGKRLTDTGWTGADGKGPYDLVLFVGLPYYMEWTILSGLKHFAPQVRTVTLDDKYQPHASFSFANITTEEWRKGLDTIIGRKEGGT
jgi:anaerobic carbon-monoxide dehydrogenase, CODH/ACS complex subunit epsilon